MENETDDEIAAGLVERILDDEAPDQEAGVDSDIVAAQEDIGDEDSDDELENSTLPNLIMEKFNLSERRRRFDEDRWLTAYRNYRGLYDPSLNFREDEKSRVFIKITKVKVLAAYSQIIAVLFGGNKFPLSVDPTRLPDGVLESVHLNLKDVPGGPTTMQGDNTIGDPGLTGDSGSGNKGWRFKETGELVSEEIRRSIDNGLLGYLKDYVEEIGADKFKPGEAPMGTEAVTFHPAVVASKKMEKKMHDQLDEADADKSLRAFAFDMACYGTGIFKGPFSENKEYPNWDFDEETGKTTYNPIVKTVPSFSHVPIWDAYPDADAVNQQDAEYFIQRHKLSRKQLRDLKSRPFFRDNVIEQLIDEGPNYTRKWWETQLDDSTDTANIDRWEVLEFWGFIDTKDLMEVEGLKIPRKLKKQKQLQVNAWLSGGKILRVTLNPFKPAVMPIYAAPYEINPYSYFGVGVAENMADSQLLINGFMRMAVDNQALSGNLIFEVDASNLAPGQNLEMHPGKVLIREAGAPGQALFATEFPNVAAQNLQLFEQARMLADESTGLPSYAHGQTNVQNTGRTASGISMLMDAASAGIKAVVKNVDDYLLRPLGRNLFAFNMQFDPDPSIKGDLEVKARGTESLMANEIRSQRLMQFLSILQNPMTAPFGKMDYIIREIAKSLELDEDKVTNNLADAALTAKILQASQPQDTGDTPPQGPVAGADAMDPTGAGGSTMGTGMAPRPGEPGFAANTGSGNGAGLP